MVKCGLVVGLLLAGCSAPAQLERSAITNAAADPGDPAVVMIVDADGLLVCSGVVVGDHTVLTAAHCMVDGIDFDGYAVQVAPGGPKLALSGAEPHPMFDAASLDNDLALLTLRDPAPVAPLAIDSRAVDATWVGQSFTVVGFGSTAANKSDGGEKRSGTAQVTAVGALDFTAVGDPSQPCAGDSGGPGLFSDGGASVVSGIISHGDTACMDHAVLIRLDIAQATFIHPYLAATAAGSAATGDRCYFDEQCASGSCLIATDEPKRSFCSQPCKKSSDCPAAMTCASDGCRPRTPSPGALGAMCAQASDCASGLCSGGLCTRSCVPSGNDCPSGFSCANTSGIDFDCVPAPPSSGCAMAPRGRPGWWAVSALLLAALWRRRIKATR